jgi:hypothetical protein
MKNGSYTQNCLHAVEGKNIDADEIFVVCFFFLHCAAFGGYRCLADDKIGKRADGKSGQ